MRVQRRFTVFITIILFLFPVIGTRAADDSCQSSPEALDGQICVVGTAWGMSFDRSGEGLYYEYISALQELVDVAFDFSALPYKRARNQFMTRQADCIYPSFASLFIRSGLIEDPDSIIMSRPLLNKKVFVFSRPGRPAIRSLDDLSGHKVAHTMGSAFPDLYPNIKAVYLPIADDRQKARILLGGRVDFMIGTMPDTGTVFKSLNVELPPYGPIGGIEQYSTGIVCYRTDDTENFMSKLNDTASDFIASGRLYDLLIRNGLTEPKPMIPAVIKP